MKELNTTELEKDGRKVNRVSFNAQENQTKARFPPPPPDYSKVPPPHPTPVNPGVAVTSHPGINMRALGFDKSELPLSLPEVRHLPILSFRIPALLLAKTCRLSSNSRHLLWNWFAKFLCDERTNSSTLSHITRYPSIIYPYTLYRCPVG